MATCEDGTDLTQCPVCLNKYTEAGDHIPRILPCHCTICERCVLRLINDKQLKCPQDRKRHPAKDGVKSFPQNKYVVSFLKKDNKPNEAGYKKCEHHNLKMMLFCKDEKCQKAICPMCISESHASHQVVYIMDEDKKKLNDQIKTLYSLNIELQRAKQQVKDDCDKKMKKLTERKKAILDELDGKLVDLMDNVTTLSDIKNDSTNPVDKIEFAKVIKDLCAEANKPVKVKFYELVENEKEIEKAVEKEETIDEDDGEALEENLRKRRELSLYIIEAKELFSVVVRSVHHLEVLSDGDVIVVNKQYAYQMTRYDRDTGEVLYSTELEDWEGGMVEVNLGGKPTLAVSYNRESSVRKSLTGWKFFDLVNMYKCTVEDFGDNVSLEKICSRSDGMLLGQSKESRKEVKGINCRYENPRLDRFTFILSSDSELKDMCVTKDPKGQEILVYTYGDALHVDTLRGRARLLIGGTIGGKKPLKCTSLTCDQRGHIFVCDNNNKRVDVFTTDGLHLGTLVSKGERGIGQPQRVRWCEKTSSLVVAHGDSKYSYYVTALKIHYN